MKKMIYPLSYNCRELIYYYESNRQKDELIFVVMDNTKKYYDRMADFYSKEDVVISDDFDKSIHDAEILILLQGTNLPDYVDKIKKAKMYGKKVYAAFSVLKLLRENGEAENVAALGNERNIENKNDGEILDINIPIIGIMGLGPYCDKFLCELYLRQYYTNQGYKVLQFGSKEFSALFGFESIPEFLLDRKIPMSDRIVEFNQYVAEKVKQEQPDIILIGVPEGIMPLSKILFNNFGEIAAIITSALNIDYTIMGVYYDDEIPDDFIKYLEGCIKYKFNSELLALCVSNTAYEPTAESFGRSVKYYHLDMDHDFKRNCNIQYPIKCCNIHNKTEMEQVAKRSYELLTNNVDVIM